MAAYEARFKEQQLKWLSRKAAELHFRLATIPNLAG
jgi:two-component SAPR family response regulator